MILVDCINQSRCFWYENWFEKEGRFLEKLSVECLKNDSPYTSFDCYKLKPKRYRDFQVQIDIRKFQAIDKWANNGFEISKPVMLRKYGFHDGIHRCSYATARGLSFPACQVRRLDTTSEYQSWLNEKGSLLVDLMSSKIRSLDRSFSEDFLREHDEKCNQAISKPMSRNDLVMSTELIGDQIVMDEYQIARSVCCVSSSVYGRCSEVFIARQI